MGARVNVDYSIKREVLALIDTWLGLVREVEQQAQILDDTLLAARNNIARDIIRENDERDAQVKLRDKEKSSSVSEWAAEKKRKVGK